MRRGWLAAGIGLVLVGGVAAGFAAAAPTRPRLLTAAQIAPEKLLPPPPAEGSAKAATELAELQTLAQITRPAELAHAAEDGRTKSGVVFATAMGPAFDLERLPATRKLLKEVRHEQRAATDAAKAHFLRKRPWIVDPRLKSCGRMDLPRSSYPSSHGAFGFATAAVLADLAPARRGALMARAEDYAVSRMVCGMHFRSDVEAGRTLGLEVSAMLLRDPGFRVDRDAAALELRAAGVIP